MQALRRRLTGLALVPLLLLAGCATKGEPEGTVGLTSTFARTLPRPLGGITYEREPLVFVLGWTGMIAGGAAGGGVIVWLFVHGDGNGDGEAFFPALVVGVAAGAVVGGLLVVLPIRGLEALWELFFGDGEEPPGPGPDG